VKAIFALAGAALLLVIGGCAKDAELARRAKGADGLIGIHFTSPAFENGKMIPKQYTADGADVSPPLSWGRGPEQTRSYVLFVEDPDAPGKLPFVHWLVYDIPAGQTSLPEGASSPNGKARESAWKEGRNGKGLSGYVGPEPSPGKAHRYVFELFALDAPLKLAPGADRQTVLDALSGHVLMQGELTGKYQR
jgi:Raf kinase inhibitor-like YbhB/YbcL family protein